MASVIDLICYYLLLVKYPLNCMTMIKFRFTVAVASNWSRVGVTFFQNLF
jgi:hypothetical protein